MQQTNTTEVLNTRKNAHGKRTWAYLLKNKTIKKTLLWRIQLEVTDYQQGTESAEI